VCSMPKNFMSKLWLNAVAGTSSTLQT
jgi:hypothetical protein